MQLRIEEQLGLLHLSGVKQALSQQQEQSMLYQEMSFEERLQLLLVMSWYKESKERSTG